MVEAKVNERNPVQVSVDHGEFMLDGKSVAAEVERIGPDSFQIRSSGQNHRVHVVRIEADTQTVFLKVNGKRAQVKLTSEIDKMLQRLGINVGAGAKASNLKAPMPGMIHSVLVEAGQKVAKGDPLLILEAMKMENVLKSPVDAVIGKVHVQKATNVDKGALLITFA